VLLRSRVPFLSACPLMFIQNDHFLPRKLEIRYHCGFRERLGANLDFGDLICRGRRILWLPGQGL